MIDIAQMRQTLCRLARDRDDIRRLTDDATRAHDAPDARRLSDGIDWSGSAEQLWDRVLNALVHSEALIDALIAVVRQSYGHAFAEGAPRISRSTPPPGAPRIAIVGVDSELGGTLRLIAQRLGRLPDVAIEVIDATHDALPPGGLDGAFVIAVCGARTGGRDVLAEAIAAIGPAAPERGGPARGAVLIWRGAALEDAPDDEVMGALKLRRTPGALKFTEPDAAARAAMDAVHPWWQAQRPPALAEADAADPPLLRAWEEAWLQARVEGWRVGRHGPLAAHARRQRIERAAIYVPLHAETGDAWLDDAGDLVLSWRARRAASGDGEETFEGLRRGEARSIEDQRALHRRDDNRPAPLEALVSAEALPHLVVEGAPGAGKTVLLQHVAYVLAALHLREPVPPHHLELTHLAAGALAQPIPILVEASALATCGGLADVTETLARLISRATNHPAPVDELRAGLARGRYLVLIDALDEVGGPDPRGDGAPDAARGQHARDQLALTLAGWARQSGQRARFVLTTRPSAWRGSTDFPEPLRLVRAAPMTGDEAQALVGRWCAAQGFDQHWAAEAHAALSEVARRHGGMDPRQNPLLLVCSLVVYGRSGHLPESPAQLYKGIVEILCESRRRDADGVRLRQSLEALFLAMQTVGGARTTIPIDRAAELLHAAQREHYPTRDAAREAIDRLYEDTGLLQFDEPAPGRVHVRAWHRSFQEYCAARALADRADAVEDTTTELVTDGRATDPAWEGVMRFVVGVHTNRAGCAARHVETLHRLAQGHPRRGRLLGLVATALREYREAFPGHGLYDTLPGELVEAFEANGGAWPVVDRLLALEALGALGDPRLERPMFVPIEGGAFTMGGDDEAPNSAPAHPVTISPLWVGRRPVTVSDFAPFVEHGWAEARWWRDGYHEADEAHPGDWLGQRHHRNRPVVRVSWYAARAFCRWATETGHAVDAWGAPAGGVIDLPTEAEWAWIARGPEGRVYPWGAEPPGADDAARAAYDWSPDRQALDSAAPIGAFPGGHRGPVVDLAGNVFEWCLDAYRASDDPSWRADATIDPRFDGSRGRGRVLRGGCWLAGSRSLRAAYRHWNHPRARGRFVGFRVVCRVGREHG